MAWRRTVGGMPQSFSHGCHVFDRAIQFVGFGQQFFSANAQFSRRREHLTDLLKAETCGSA
jgi:hypothetical protein